MTTKPPCFKRTNSLGISLLVPRQKCKTKKTDTSADPPKLWRSRTQHIKPSVYGLHPANTHSFSFLLKTNATLFHLHGRQRGGTGEQNNIRMAASSLLTWRRYWRPLWHHKGHLSNAVRTNGARHRGWPSHCRCVHWQSGVGRRFSATWILQHFSLINKK